MFPTSQTPGSDAKGLVWSQRFGLWSKGLPLAGPLDFSKTKGLVKAGGQYQTFVATLIFKQVPDSMLLCITFKSL